MTDLHWMSALELADALEAGDLSSREITEALVARGDALEERLGTFLHRTSERALAEADAADARRGAGEARSHFDGIPVAYKDLFTTKGVPTTSGSKILKGFVPPYDATVVARSDAAGLPMLGKTNMDEFAMGSSTENSGYQTTRNPWDTDRVPGGSSGGSAAAVAAGMTPWAWGTDTGGSIRQPASLCSLVGVKPTYGFVSRYGMIAFASSLDQAGPLTRTVADAAALLEIAAGHDPMDSTSIRDDRPALLDGIDGGIKGLRIGVVKEFLGQGDDGVRAVIDEAYARLEKLGADDGRGFTPVVPTRHPGVLPRCSGGVLVQPRALRRRPLRSARRGRRHHQDDLSHAHRRFRSRGQAPDHARDLRVVRRLLRRLLRQGAESPHPDHAGSRQGVRGGRPDRQPVVAHHRVQDRRAHRGPPGDVSVRHLHGAGQPRRQRRHQRAGGTGPRRRTSGRPAVDRQVTRRADDVQSRLRVRSRTSASPPLPRAGRTI